MENAAILRWAYAANILILVPVCYGLIAGSGVAGVFEGKVAESAGLRLLVASLYVAILVASMAGLKWPAFFAPILIAQIIYKTLWLAMFAAPLVLAGWSGDVPWGISSSFIGIVLIYPILLLRAQ
ncbi:hypothetical protein D5I55_05980 [Chakrabartia godavariana]|nr:hypothetical protein D5I55_05980 [Chakrabartia godavariana]